MNERGLVENLQRGTPLERHAANKIERLSMALELIKNEPREDAASWMRGVARAALGEDGRTIPAKGQD